MLAKLEKQFPNDADLGAAVRQFIRNNQDCCSNLKNMDQLMLEGKLFSKCKICKKYTKHE